LLAAKRKYVTDENGVVIDHLFRYYYDENGKVLAETKDGKPKRYYVYADEEPVAQIRVRLRKNGRFVIKGVMYLGTDNLLTPRVATNETGDVAWRWDSNAFGQGKTNKDPDMDDKNRNVRLRFPGQFRVETGLFYNYFRYYDPTTGRYITSDPIGLDGGLNPYLYVEANPLRFTDPRGLDNVGCTTEPLTIDGRCKRICCAIHDKCYDDNSCTADSWTSDSGCNAKACDNCNKEVVKCFVWCGQAEPMGIEPAPGTPEYYCPAQHRFITIPGDFPTVEAAKVVCGS